LNRDAKIMVLGAAGMVGSACVRWLKADGWTRILTPQRHLYDLTWQNSAEQCIREASLDVTGFTGDIYYDTSKPDGAPVKLLDASQIHAMGWRPKVQLRAGLEEVYQDTFGPAVAEVA
jgi:GDP-L-fucose synthase